MTSHNPYYNWTHGSTSGPPPTLGALPFYQPPHSTHLVFELTHFRPDILNCSMVGPEGRPYPVVTPDPSKPAGMGSVVRSFRGDALAEVEWGRHTVVTVHGGIAPRQRVGHWLRLSPDGRQRMMQVHGKTYIWNPQADHIALFKAQTSQLCCRVFNSRAGYVRIEIDSHSVHQGLLESIVVATVLLNSGRPLD